MVMPRNLTRNQFSVMRSLSWAAASLLVLVGALIYLMVALSIESWATLWVLWMPAMSLVATIPVLAFFYLAHTRPPVQTITRINPHTGAIEDVEIATYEDPESFQEANKLMTVPFICMALLLFPPALLVMVAGNILAVIVVFAMIFGWA